MDLRASEIHKYFDRDPDERSLAALDAQVSVCLPWTELLARRAMEHANWERRGLLGRLVRVDPPSAEGSVQAQQGERAEAA